MVVFGAGVNVRSRVCEKKTWVGHVEIWVIYPSVLCGFLAVWFASRFSPLEVYKEAEEGWLFHRAGLATRVK